LRTRSHHKSILNTNDKIDQTIEETDSFYNPKKKIKWIEAINNFLYKKILFSWHMAKINYYAYK
jgi:hypothetical protein